MNLPLSHLRNFLELGVSIYQRYTMEITSLKFHLLLRMIPFRPIYPLMDIPGLNRTVISRTRWPMLAYEFANRFAAGHSTVGIKNAAISAFMVPQIRCTGKVVARQDQSPGKLQLTETGDARSADGHRCASVNARVFFGWQLMSRINIPGQLFTREITPIHLHQAEAAVHMPT